MSLNVSVAGFSDKRLVSSCLDLCLQLSRLVTVSGVQRLVHIPVSHVFDIVMKEDGFKHVKPGHVQTQVLKPLKLRYVQLFPSH